MVTTLVKDLCRRNDLKESDLLGIGIGFPGHVRYRDGTVITSSNLKGFKNFPLLKAVRENFHIPVILDNDTNAQAFAEYKYGAGRKYDSMIFLTISTGIGTGIILDGRLYRGITGTAGEVGHTIIDPHSSLKCTCGNYGCLMALACGLAIPYLVKKKLHEGISTSMPLPDDLSKIDGKLIREGLASGDGMAESIVSECGDYIGIGIYNIFQVFNPPAIIIGGGLCCWGNFYLDRIRQKFLSLARDMIYDPIDIKESELGSDAGLIGAATLLLE
jgi:glucokinase